MQNKLKWPLSGKEGGSYDQGWELTPQGKHCARLCNEPRYRSTSAFFITQSGIGKGSQKMDCILHVLDYTELHSEVNHPRRCLTHYICASKSLLGGRVSQHKYERGSFIVDWGTIKLNGLEDGHGLLRPRYTLKAVNRNGTGLHNCAAR